MPANQTLPIFLLFPFSFFNTRITVQGVYILQLLEILESNWNLKTLLEILETFLNLYGPPGNFCVKCQ